MPDSNLIDALIAAAGGVVAYFVKSTRDDNREQDRKIEALQREQAALLSREEFRQDMHLLRQEMNANFDKVFSKLDKKADK
jgi:transcriptional regulator of NAD metabolism